MKVLLEAFVDNNFGDNLFLHIVTSKNPEHTFYMLEKEQYAASYKVVQNEISNLVVCKEEDFLNGIDAMCVVGGDLFRNRGDYSELIRHAHIVKKQGGKVVFWGFSLFPKYTWDTWFDLMVLFSYADQIVVREEESYRQLKKHIPWLKADLATDLAFTFDVAELKRKPVKEGLLGVSVRKKVQVNAEEHYQRYCNAIAKIIEDYLEESEKNEVRFLALSTGNYDDRVVAENIKNLCKEKYHKRMICSSFEGNVEAYLEELQMCESMLCTRFHALVFAILLEKPFLPIIYEEKMKRLLHAIGYQGEALLYENIGEQKWKCQKSSGVKLQSYLKKATRFEEQLKMEDGISKRENIVFYGLYRIKKFLLCEIYRKCFVKNSKSE